MKNLLSYDGVELIDRFSELEFENYCTEKLRSCDKHVEFIKKIPGSIKKICEIGSGNSKLLYNLEKNNLLERGVGYEVSRSRYLFAEKFKKRYAYNKVENRNVDVLQDKTEDKFDLIIGVDIVMQLIAPLYKSAEVDLLKWVSEHLEENGYFLVEIQDFTNELKRLSLNKGKPIREWQEFSETDPFQYMLTEIAKDLDGNLIYNKRFISRENRDVEQFVNVIKPYSKKELLKMLNEHKFGGGWGIRLLYYTWRHRMWRIYCFGTKKVRGLG